MAPSPSEMGDISRAWKICAVCCLLPPRFKHAPAQQSVSLTKQRPLSSLLLPPSQVFLSAPRLLNLEEAIGYVAGDELLEVTPAAVRIRKEVKDTWGHMGACMGGRICKREHGRMGVHEAGCKDMGACGGCMNAPAKGVTIQILLHPSMQVLDAGQRKVLAKKAANRH